MFIHAGMIAVSLLVAGPGEREPRQPVPLKSFVLDDVHGLWGGHTIWAAEGKLAVVQAVGRPPPGRSGLWEKRYVVKLSARQWVEVERLVGAHGLFVAKMEPKRPGHPDEAHPIIMVAAKDGTTAKAWKWIGDKEPNFDPVYAYLRLLCRVEGQLVREGPFDWDWRPDGFAMPSK